LDSDVARRPRVTLHALVRYGTGPRIHVISTRGKTARRVGVSMPRQRRSRPHGSRRTLVVYSRETRPSQTRCCCFDRLPCRMTTVRDDLNRAGRAGITAAADLEPGRGLQHHYWFPNLRLPERQDMGSWPANVPQQLHAGFERPASGRQKSPRDAHTVTWRQDSRRATISGPYRRAPWSARPTPLAPGFRSSTTCTARTRVAPAHVRRHAGHDGGLYSRLNGSATPGAKPRRTRSPSFFGGDGER